ncbi:hypothetical protein ACI79D_14825 [Geodermatophilus sp. SYSU D00708]
MPVVPAHCDTCGLTWEPTIGGIRIDNSTNITLGGGGSLPCPRCRARARWIEGTFNFRDDVIEVLSAPHWTWGRLHELSDVLHWTARNWSSIDPLEAIGRVEEVSPEAAGALRRALAYGRGNALTLIFGLVTILAWLFPQAPAEEPAPQQSTTVTIDPEQMAQLLDEMERARDAASSPAPTPSPMAPPSGVTSNPTPPPPAGP